MFAPTKFVWRDQQHMVIEPNPHMLKSGLIQSVRTRGGLFGVNLETGFFGIIPEEVVRKLDLKEPLSALTVTVGDGRVFTGTVNSRGGVRFYINGGWSEYKSLAKFMELFN